MNKILSLVGLATRAGKTVSGEFSTEHAVKSDKAFLVVVAEEASDNTKKKFRNMCLYYEVPIYFYGLKEQLGKAMGKEYRASFAVVDENFAKAIEAQIGNSLEANTEVVKCQKSEYMNLPKN